MQQVSGEYLGWGFEAKAFSWCVVMLQSDGVDVVCRALAQVCFARKQAAEAAIGVFDAAFLPRAVRIAKVCIDPERIPQFVMVGEFGAVVLGQSTAQLRWQRR